MAQGNWFNQAPCVDCLAPSFNAHEQHVQVDYKMAPVSVDAEGVGVDALNKLKFVLQLWKGNRSGSVRRCQGAQRPLESKKQPTMRLN